MLNSIGADLQKSINKAGIAKQVEAFQVCDLWEKTVCQIFGKQIVGQSQALYFKNGILTVAVLNPVLAQEFKFKEEEIKNILNSNQREKVRKIRFEI